MVGNVVGLYSYTTGNAAVVPSNNNTGLYNDNGGFIPVSDDINISGNINAGGYIYANGNIVTNSYFVGDGSQLTNISANAIVGAYGNANVEALLDSGTITGNIITLGNVSGAYILGDGSQLTNLPQQYSNANVAAYLPVYTGNIRGGNLSIIGNTVTGNLRTTGAAGNITGANYVVGNFFVGDGSLLTNLPGSTYGNGNVASYLQVYGGNIDATQVANVGIVNIASQGTVQLQFDPTGVYNVYDIANGNWSYLDSSGFNFQSNTTGTFQSVSFNNDGDINASGSISATGNIVANIDVYANGNLGAAGIISAPEVSTSNIQATGGNLQDITIHWPEEDGSFWSSTISDNRGNDLGNSYNLLTLETITNPLATAGNARVVIAGEMSNNYISMTATNDGGFGSGLYVVGKQSADSTSNVVINYANVVIDTPDVIATNNLTAAYFYGDGSNLTGLPASYSNADVATFLADFGSNVIVTTGNVTAGNISTTGNVSVGGSLLSDDITSIGDVTVYGNQVITGNLTVQGNTTTINSNVITTNDKTITVANNQSTGANVNGAGIDAGNPAIATWYYNDATTSWQSNIGITPTANGTLSLGTNTNRWDTIYGTGANIAGNISATGNIQGNYILGNGSQLTGLPATYTNANVTTLLAALGSNVISSTANITTTANVAGAFFIGNGSALTGITSSYGNANVTTLLASLGSNVISSTANITTTANVAGAFFIGNGSQLTGITSSYANANVANFLANYGANTISSTGNITTTANISGGNLLGTIRTAAQPNITSLGTLTGLGVNATTSTNIVLTVNKSGGNTGNITIFGAASEGNIDLNPAGSSGVKFVNLNAPTVVAGNLSATGNITGSYFLGNGSQLTGITGNYSNANVTALLASLGSNVISSTANITTTANVAANSISTTSYGKIQGDFTSAVNTGRTLVQTTATGTNGSTFLSLIPSALNTNVNQSGVGAFGNADSGNASFITTLITSTDGRVTTSKNGTGTYLPFTIWTSNAEKVRVDTNGNVGVANTAPVDKLSVNGTGYFSGNVAVAGLLTDGYYYANGTPVSFGGSTYGNSNVATFLAAFGSNTISSTGNITTTGNISGSYILGNGSQLTGLPATYGNSNVTTLLASLGSNIISSTANITTTGNVSGGNLLGIGSSISGINAFGNIAVAGQTTVSADNTTDTLTLVAGTNITLTTDAPNNKITITSTASGGETISPFLLMGG